MRLAYAEDFALVQKEAYQRWHSAEEELEEALTRVNCALAAHLPREDQHHLWRLLCQPEAWAQAQQRRAHFVEELLRVNPPLHRFGRLALQTHRLGDTEIQAGQRVVVFFSAANCRAGAGQNHLSFGAGVHRCPGSGMARRILKPPNPVIS